MIADKISWQGAARDGTELTELNVSHPWSFLLGVVPLALSLYLWIRSDHPKSILYAPVAWFAPSLRMGPLRGRMSVALRLLASWCLLPIVAGIWGSSLSETRQQTDTAWMIVLDVSSSMTAEDFEPGNRLTAAREMLGEFVAANSGAEMGLVVFAANSRLEIPLTSDHGALLRALERIRPAEFGEDGTTIGSGITSGLNRLRRSPVEVRRILIITDGVSNRGALSPLDAARLARSLKVSVDVVGIGTSAFSRFWVPTPDGSASEVRAQIEIDHDALRRMTAEAQGSYQFAASPAELRTSLLSLIPDSDTWRTQWVRVRESVWLQLLAATALMMLCAEFLLREFFLAELPH